MKKTYFKNLFRDIKNTPSRFLSILAIIIVGVAFYSGVRATSPAMKTSADSYYDKQNFMDFKLISTLGLTENDLEQIEKHKDIKKAEATYSMDAVIEKDDSQFVVNVNSLPKDKDINNIRIIKGRRAEKPNEIVVESNFMDQSEYKINDFITLESGSDDNINDDLKQRKFKIVGTAISPLYLSEQRQISSVGNGNVSGFVYILPEVFKNEAYTEIYAVTQSKESKKSIIDNEKYKEYTEKIEQDLKDLGAERSEIRYKEVYEQANTKLIDAEDELQESKIQAEKEISDGYKKLENAQYELDQGYVELNQNKKLFNEKIADGKEKLQSGTREIEDAKKEIAKSTKEIEEGKIQIEQAKEKLDQAEKDLNQAKEQIITEIDKAISEGLEKLKELIELEPDKEEYIEQYKLLSELYQQIKDRGFSEVYEELKENQELDPIKELPDIKKIIDEFDQAEKEIADGREEVKRQENQIKQGQREINQALAQIQTSTKEIEQGLIELEKEKQQGLRGLEKARIEIINGQKEIDENLEKLKAEQKKVEKKIEDGEKQIEENREKLKEIKDPEWYVLGRSQNLGYETYRQDSDRIDNIGKVFPLIFFLVAALVSLTTMTRMVQEKRTEIGTFKALGYSSAAIISHYLIYSLMASILGSIIGVLIGFKLFPNLIINAYAALYSIPDIIVPFISSLALQASILAVLFTTLAAAISAYDELREVPAALMRPKPPKAGKKILLERMDFVWNRMKFTSKVTARNIFRYKQRLFMTVVGIAACTGLMITGFGLRDGIIGATDAQFEKIYKYDIQGTLNRDRDIDEKNEVKRKVLDDENMRSVLFINSQSGSVKSKEEIDEDAYLIVPESKDQLNKHINLYLKDEKLNLKDQGAIITEKLSRLIGKNIGDVIEITIDDEVFEAEILDITEQYIQHYIYISPDYYEEITGKSMTYNGFYGTLKDNSQEVENDTSQRLKAIIGINSVQFKSNLKSDYNQSVESVNAVVLILIASAGVLAFVVIYNLTNINITERRRELATIKLLGFYDTELAAYIYRENIILTFLGSFTGIFVGIILNKFVLTTAETNVIKFLEKINPIYFLYSVLLTVLFSVIVNLAMYKRFAKIDMIESLKSAE